LLVIPRHSAFVAAVMCAAVAADNDDDYDGSAVVVAVANCRQRSMFCIDVRIWNRYV